MSTTARPIVLVLGAGAGIGANVASCFADAGYAVALAARSLPTSKQNPSRLEIHADLSQPSVIPAIFSTVEKELGEPPSVVIYNAASRTLAQADDPLGSMPLEDYHRDMTVGLHNAVAAAQEAVRGFKTLPKSRATTYIYSGNKLNVMSDPKTWPFGIARTGMAHFIWDCSVAYQEKGYRFYFTDERLSDGSPSRELMDPVERAAVYLRLCRAESQLQWHYTYVKGRGYVDFRGVDDPWAVKGS
ncbi:hypothetical protein M409DRAFT_22414 [Zasmidium cellare ATCC 36951]|uniref:Uncharacterized protein n=1 Tax=Zasmidium cellare ATCC 36951 TaxID=1080233 RepID=A0A6A6CLY2_ZASCE|nr:uncharacterized protein M409DRAFT_22414 [Zasmidium cellare ATCC 36951]KAF2167613.1 hypothetical protein M409DRAFT_22414 [Zasmidium cellare ATCC 36951]